MSDINPGEHISPDEKAEAADPNVGTGTPDTAPWDTIEIPWLRREPVIALALLVVLTQLGVALTALAAGASPVVAVLLLGLAGVVTIAAGVVRRHTTALARPRLDPETPLIPAPPER